VSDHLALSASAALYEIPAVDVLVTCATATVSPIIQRLALPPSPERVLNWSVTPQQAGHLTLRIALLILNEPIHVTMFYVEVDSRTADRLAADASR
jgi:hypothetical protein